MQCRYGLIAKKMVKTIAQILIIDCSGLDQSLLKKCLTYEQSWLKFDHSRVKGLVNMSNEESVKTRRGIKVYNSNPFLQSGMVKPKTKRITNKRGDLMVVGETGEIVAPIAGFWQAEEVDSIKFVKLYVNGVRAFKDLTNAGTRVFEVLYLEVQKAIGQDRVYLSFTT